MGRFSDARRLNPRYAAFQEELEQQERSGGGTMARWPDTRIQMSRRAALRLAGASAALASAVVAGTRPGATTLAQSAQGAQSTQGAARIAGSWLSTRTTDNQQGPSPAPDLETFIADGGYVQSSDLSASTGHGAWVLNDDGSIGLTFLKLGFDPAAGPNAPPVTIKVVGTLQLGADGNTYSGRYRDSVTLPSGMVVQSETGSAQGTRLQVEAL
jgi:hypothetical protein